jgi:hypothetical protein
MIELLKDIQASNGDRIVATDIRAAVTAAPLRYGDDAQQVFEADGSTTYTERGGDSRGEWEVQDGRFKSFWPPSYCASYELHWIVEGGAIVGLTFVDATRGSRFDGRYEQE